MNKNPGKSVPKWEIWEHYHFPDCYFDWINYNAAAAAKSLHSCPTLCDPIDGSPPGSHVAGILQARALEWVAISFSNAWKWKVKVKLLSHVRPTRLLRPWDFPGKSTGVGCHCLLQYKSTIMCKTLALQRSKYCCVLYLFSKSLSSNFIFRCLLYVRNR